MKRVSDAGEPPAVVPVVVVAVDVHVALAVPPVEGAERSVRSATRSTTRRSLATYKRGYTSSD